MYLKKVKETYQNIDFIQLSTKIYVCKDKEWHLKNHRGL